MLTVNVSWKSLEWCCWQAACNESCELYWTVLTFLHYFNWSSYFLL